MKRIILILTLINLSLFAQSSLEVFDHDNSSFPLIKSEIFIFDDNLEVKTDLPQDRILVNDKGLIADLTSYECSESNPKDSISYVILTDKSLDSVSQNRSNGIKAVSTILNTINLEKYDCAIAEFDVQNYLLSDFSNNKDTLLKRFSKYGFSKGTDLNAGLTKEPLSGFSFADYTANDIAVILITDGNKNLDLSKLSDFFSVENVELYTFYAGNKIPKKLGNLTLGSGGKYFDEIDTDDEIISSVRMIKAFSEGYDPCEIEWQTEISCNDTSNVKVYVPSMEISDEFFYVFEAENKPAIISEPLDLGFSSVIPGKSKKLDITITAKNSDIFISDIYLQDDRFEITKGKIQDDVLQQGDSRVLRIKYTPTNTGTQADSAIVFTKLIVESDACSGKEIYVTGGFPNTPPVKKTIRILNPSCGQTLLVGDTISVEWVGLLRRDVVQIEYSIDGGKNWRRLAKNTTGLDYSWIVPDSVSENCLVRVIQMWPNNVGKTLDLPHDDDVISGFFNKEGNLVITASLDTTAVIWNSNNGAKIFTLKSHTQPLTYGVFDPLEKYAATSSRDSTAKLWDIDTGEEIRTFTGHTGELNSVNFIYDGSRIVTSSSDGTARVWDVETGEELSNIRANEPITGRTWYADFDPTGEMVITAGNDGVAKVWNWQDKEIVMSFDTRNNVSRGSTKHAIFNHDGTKVAAVSTFNPKKLYVWDIENGKENYMIEDTLFSLTHNTDSTSNDLINSSSFYYDGIREYILTAGSDDLARKWDASTGKPLDPHIFKEHDDVVETAVFNFDARRVLTTSWDNTAKIWNLDQRDLQMDTTDCPFSIAYANAKGRIVDLGDFPVNSYNEITVDSLLINLSKFSYKVNDLKIVENTNNSFLLTNESLQSFYLDSAERKDFEILFAPENAGVYTCKFEIKIPGSTIEAELTAEAVNKDIDEYTSLVDYGKVEVGELRDTTFTVIVTNKSADRITIDSINIAGYSPLVFNILTETSDITLNSEEVLPITIRFSPTQKGLKNAQMMFYHEGNFNPAMVNLFGISGILSRDTVLLHIPEVSGEPGDIIDVPVYIRKSKSRDLPDNLEGFSADLEFNSTLLEPLGDFASDKISEYRRTISIELPKEFSQDSLLREIRFKVGLGNDSVSTLDLKYAAPIGKAKLSILEQDGKFTLKGLCEEGGPRLYDPTYSLELSQNKPNPFVSSTKIDLNILEPGKTELYLTDINGKKVMQVIDKYMIPGKYEIDVNAEGLPSGVYFYILETPSNKVSRRMEIGK